MPSLKNLWKVLQNKMFYLPFNFFKAKLWWNIKQSFLLLSHTIHTTKSKKYSEGAKWILHYKRKGNKKWKQNRSSLTLAGAIIVIVWFNFTPRIFLYREQIFGHYSALILCATLIQKKLKIVPMTLQINSKCWTRSRNPRGVKWIETILETKENNKDDYKKYQ